MRMIFKLGITNGTVYDMGMSSYSAQNTNAATNVVGLRFDPDQSVALLAVCGDGTVVSNAIIASVATNVWYDAYFSSTVAGTVNVSVNGGGVVAITNHVPTVQVSPYFRIANRSSGGAGVLTVDAFKASFSLPQRY